MKSETLERLLIDRACGELSADVNELLEEHLAEHLGAEREIEETVALARRALQPARAVSLPEPRQAAPTKNVWRVPIWAVGMAACFAAGMALTRWTMGPPTGMEPVQRASMARMNKETERAEVVWISPVRMPVIKTKS